MWENLKDEIKCYYKVRELAFKNLSNPTVARGFVSPFIDTAFNGHLFICRAISETNGKDSFTRFDPVATGPYIIP